MSALITALVSGGLLALVVALSLIESRRGSRLFLSGARAWLDRQVVRLGHALTRLQLHLGTGALRIMFHRIAHDVLGMLARGSAIIGGHLQRLQQRNRRIVRSVRKQQEKTHLDLIAEHKAVNGLSPEEREKLKSQSLEGEVR